MNSKYPWFLDFYSKNPFRNNSVNVVINSAGLLVLDYVGEKR
jgi:hypothetical protein